MSLFSKRIANILIYANHHALDQSSVGRGMHRAKWRSRVFGRTSAREYEGRGGAPLEKILGAETPPHRAQMNNERRVIRGASDPRRYSSGLKPAAWLSS